MGTKLNPDGTKIRALRVKRGWTQEQLAEIAGISLRTIQRAEAASSAAFETIRAIAAAFEAEFDQLIKQDSCATANQGMQTEGSSAMSRSDPEPERAAIEQPATTARRSWATPVLAVSTMAAGLAIGMFLTSYTNDHSESLASVQQSVSPGPPRAPGFYKPSTEKNLQRAASESKTVLHPAIKAEIAQPEMPDQGIKDSPAFSGASSPSTEPSHSVETASLELIQQSSSIDIPPQELILPVASVMPDVPVGSNVESSIPGNSTEGPPDTGAVRQAIGSAAKKTGGFFSKAGASIKRAF